MQELTANLIGRFESQIFLSENAVGVFVASLQRQTANMHEEEFRDDANPATRIPPGVRRGPVPVARGRSEGCIQLH